MSDTENTAKPYRGPSSDEVRSDITYLADSWPLLVTFKIQGTARSWVETPRRAVMSETDLERMGKKGVPRQAPGDIQVLSLLQSIVSAAEDVARTVITVAGLKKVDHLPMYSAAKDPIPWLTTCNAWLDAAHGNDDLTLPWVSGRFKPLATATAHLLGDVRAGQVMNGICPFCYGRTKGVTAGERTLQIHYPDPDDPTDEPVIACRGLNCRPPSNVCGYKTDAGHPCWPRREWDWLASMLLTPEEALRQRFSTEPERIEEVV
ncbi:hypothetical protein CH267_00895 [Rhodococcus sp. 06-621-2]|nr:hypothetical protein [Rhodococcus sp. 06-621-2]OZC62131.1 hypothetical protein CH267_00895 [Rhodococcus sp. 06-621-2]